MKRAGTPGGNRLKALREDRGRTQLDVELDARLGIGYLQRVESGKVKYPEWDTLERILAALDAPYTERRDILELFGYVVNTPLPKEAEIKQAVEGSRTQLEEAVFPTYLLDCGHRLLAWNALVPRIFANLALSESCLSMLRILFDPIYGVTALIANPGEFFPAQIRALRYEMRLFRGESWYDALIEVLLADCPVFARYWQEELQSPLIAARPLVPVVVTVPGAGLLHFRLASEPFAQDRRFRVIYYLPADSTTMQRCAVWTEQ